MTWQAAKAGFSLDISQIDWRRLVQVIALLFLLTQQAWAGLLCHCQHEDEGQMSHACCLTAHHCASAEAAECAGEPAHAESSCADETESADQILSADNSCTAPQPAMANCCCDAAPQTEPQAITSVRESVPVDSHQSFVSIEWQIASATMYYNPHPPNRTRPLYLSFRCFLI